MPDIQVRAVYKDWKHARDAVMALEAAGFRPEQVQVLARADGASPFGPWQSLRAPAAETLVLVRCSEPQSAAARRLLKAFGATLQV